MINYDLFTRIDNQFTRFLIAGVLNTLSGMCVFGVLHYSLGEHFHYMAILVLANFLSVIIAYLNLKFFVFKTIGNYTKEFIRCYLSYLKLLFLNMFLLWGLVDLLKLDVLASQFLILIFLSTFSFFIHKLFTFKRR